MGMATHSLYAGFYVSGSTGLITPIDQENNHRGQITVGAGYAFPTALKAEIFYKFVNRPMLGAGGRLTFFPLLNISAGVVERFTSEKDSDRNQFGFYFGPGIHFELIPKLDFFVDLNYYNFEKHEFAELAGGMRFHF